MDIDGGSSSPARAGDGSGAQQPQRPDWRPPLPFSLLAYGTSSSTSAGSLSTTYTSGSSHLQSSCSDQGDPWLEVEEEREKTRGDIKGLVQEFLAAGDDQDATTLVLERWFSDLGVSWVLSIIVTDDKSAGAFVFQRRLQHFARSWIVALTVIQNSIFTYVEGLWNQEEAEGVFSSLPAASEFARFLQTTISKMLPFVDMIMAHKAVIVGPCIQHTNLSSNGEVPAEEKLVALIAVRDGLSAASKQIQMWFICPPLLGSRGTLDEMSNLLSAKLAELDEAVWDTVDEILTDNNHDAGSMDNSQALERSPDIDKATGTIVNCIKVLSTNYGLLHQIVCSAVRLSECVPEYSKVSPLFRADSCAVLIVEMIFGLQEKLARVSQSFPDQSLRFLFLLNNTYFVWQQLHTTSNLEPYMPALTRKIDDHMQRYLQMSWIPVLSCLQDPTPLCLGRYSPLAKFQSEFQKTYTAQKLWKVPDPELRRRLRKAIIETVISAFTRYLEDNKITTPRVTQLELEDMLQDLFEG
ncbi:hypothetical protein BAE44_0007906 [Dichanthelium oligosanthes]|uniref:Exocyst subunit Exo70 family protein n=1 Tax=Dichanthelium oligosanthes TaxID=888268 RepID=A0A1E5W152_9POAL|nr:hypothetical protein BAE44_0007906 [Dichanthelium oligosanthes]